MLRSSDFDWSIQCWLHLRLLKYISIIACRSWNSKIWIPTLQTEAQSSGMVLFQAKKKQSQKLRLWQPISSWGRYYLLSLHTVLTSPSLEISFMNIQISSVTLFHTATVPPIACLQQTNKMVCSSSHCHSATIAHSHAQHTLFAVGEQIFPLPGVQFSMHI